MGRMTTKTGPSVVRLFQEDGYTHVDPGLPQWLLRELHVSKRSFKLGGYRGFQTDMEQVPLYDIGSS